jgi:hypothetical protein
MKSSFKTLLLAGALLTGTFVNSGPAQAANFVININAQTANFQRSLTPLDPFLFDKSELFLNENDFGAPVTVMQGDTISSTISLDQRYTIQASQLETKVNQFFLGSGFSGALTDVDGVFEFFDGASLVKSVNYSSLISGALASSFGLLPPNNGAFSFDRIVNNLTITTLDQPATLFRTQFRYTLISINNPAPVPEPATWAMLITGFGLVGGAMRRRTRIEPSRTAA